MKQPSPKKIFNEILTDVSKAFGVSKKDLLSESRGSQDVAHARQIAIYAHHYRARCTMRVTMELFGRAQGTVTHAIQQAEKRTSKDKKLAAIVKKICRG